MNKISILLSIFCLLFAGVAGADYIIEPVSGTSYSNPTSALHDSGDSAEEIFLEDILGLTFNDPALGFISKDETGNPLDVKPDFWDYAILKFGGGIKNCDNDGDNNLNEAAPLIKGWLAIGNDGNNIIDDNILSSFGITSLSGIVVKDDDGDWGPLSHISYFKRISYPVPEPATMLLLGSGLIGIASFSRKKNKK